MMDHAAAAKLVSKLEDAIDKVLEASALIGQSSKREFENYVQILVPARLGIYVSLQGIYAKYPDLAPQDVPEKAEGEALVRPPLDHDERPLEANARRRIRSLFQEAHALVNEVQAHTRLVRSSELPEPQTRVPTLSSAADAIELALARLPR